MISTDPADRLALQLRMKKLFTEGFTVVDIAEPLLSFDADSEATEVASALAQSRDPVGGVRRNGRIVEYVRANDLTGGTCAAHAREIDPDQVVPHSAPIPQVVERLEDTEYCFVSVVGQIDAFVIRGHFEKPPVRMWLFGMITIVETFLTETIAALYPDDAWIGLVSTGRMRPPSAASCSGLTRSSGSDGAGSRRRGGLKAASRSPTVCERRGPASGARTGR